MADFLDMPIGEIAADSTKLFASHRFEPVAVAHSLSTMGTFSDPFQFPTGPSAHLAPMLPNVFALINRTTESEATRNTIRQTLSAIVASIQYAMLPALAVALGFPLRVGIISSLLPIGVFSFLPSARKRLETEGLWEHTYAALGLVLLGLLTVRYVWTAKITWSKAIAFGLCWGCYLLCIPTMGPVLCAWLIVGAFLQNAEARPKYLLLCLAIVSATIAAIAPWTLRNYHVLGSAVLIRSNLGLELYVSNNGCAKANFAEMLPCFNQNQW